MADRPAIDQNVPFSTDRRRSGRHRGVVEDLEKSEKAKKKKKKRTKSRNRHGILERARAVTRTPDEDHFMRFRQGKQKGD